MYLANLKSLLVISAQATFDADYPESDFRDLWVSIEYPMAREHYPGIWVDFEPTQQIEAAGIDDVEFALAPDNVNFQQFKRWRFQGYATYTIVALSSLERDRLFDEMVKVIAFGSLNPARSVFRQTIENNALIGTEFDWDQIGAQGWGQAQGTPWGTEEVIYEGTVQVECIGEFVSDMDNGLLVPLKRIDVYEVPTGSGEVFPPAVTNDPAPWH
jgi:hypothetical protein